METNWQGLASSAGAEASAHELFNEAAEWLNFSRGTGQLLADLVHDAEEVDCELMAVALETLAALTQRGADCLARGHGLIQWERAQALGIN
ncbi:DUF908 domain-containing protein [Bacillus sp. NP157]|nr:DUF908 domain-containing protein [Bacillus sp. NP157]